MKKQSLAYLLTTRGFCLKHSADADDADDASADATLGRHLIGQSACSAGRAERRSGRLTESLEATKSLS